MIDLDTTSMINIIGVLLIFTIIWWFWLHKAKSVTVNDDRINISVQDGVYLPANIEIPEGKAITLSVTRYDQTPCAEMFQVPDLDISVALPVGKNIDIPLPAMETGEYPFHCQMNMYKGTFTVA